MIESRKDILPLLKKYLDTEREFSSQTLKEKNGSKWTKVRLDQYHYGVVCGKFREGDNATIQTLKMGVSDNALRNESYEYCAREIRTQKELAQKELAQKELAYKELNLYSILTIIRQLKNHEREIQDLQILPIKKWIKQYCNWVFICRKVKKLSFAKLKVFLYLYFSFENYKSMLQSPYNPDISYLTSTYKNIFNKQSQFGKYGIVPIDQDRTLLPIVPPRIYDQSLDKTFFTKNIPLSLLKQFSDMLFNGMINNLAVRLKNERGYNGKISTVHLKEAFERGEPFNLVNLGNYSVSKLYSKNYNDSLWVVIDPPNITFEELCDDFEDYNDMIVTQVVHLQYENLEGESYITHIDHEYVFYTLDEYEKRQNDAKQKGEAQKRLKSFKIDNSKIPFTFNCEIHRKDENGNDLPVEKEQFLCYVLECYFKHKDLLSEYFKKLNHNSLTSDV